MNHRTLVSMVAFAAVLGSALPLWADGSVRFTGALSMAVDHFDPGAFGLTPTEVNPGEPLLAPFEAHFTVAFIGGGTSDPSNFPAVLEDFDLDIGNAHWDETMLDTEMLVRVQNDTLLGIQAFITVTRPDHPDLMFFLPSSPGIWEAHDIVNGVDHGRIGGLYVIIESATVAVPEPASFALAATGLFGLCAGRRFRGK